MVASFAESDRHSRSVAEAAVSANARFDSTSRSSAIKLLGARGPCAESYLSSIETRIRSAVRSTPSLLLMMEQVLATVL